MDRFTRAIQYLGSNEDIDFICNCGDIIDKAADAVTDAQKEDVGNRWTAYDDTIRLWANGKPVQGIAGNHEGYAYCSSDEAEYIINDVREKIHEDVCYSFTHGGDVFFMLSCDKFQNNTYADGTLKGYRQKFTGEDLEKIYNDFFEKHKDQRCFVIMHVPPHPYFKDSTYEGMAADFAGNGTTHIPIDVWARYKNLVVFHGHAHGQFSLQTGTYETANYAEYMGFRSVHCASLGDHAEGYIVDVYDKGIHLQGYNFETGKHVPVASYWIDTTEQSVPAADITEYMGWLYEDNEEA